MWLRCWNWVMLTGVNRINLWRQLQMLSTAFPRKDIKDCWRGWWCMDAKIFYPNSKSRSSKSNKQEAEDCLGNRSWFTRMHCWKRSIKLWEREWCFNEISCQTLVLPINHPKILESSGQTLQKFHCIKDWRLRLSKVSHQVPLVKLIEYWARGQNRSKQLLWSQQVLQLLNRQPRFWRRISQLRKVPPCPGKGLTIRPRSWSC